MLTMSLSCNSSNVLNFDCKPKVLNSYMVDYLKVSKSKFFAFAYYCMQLTFRWPARFLEQKISNYFLIVSKLASQRLRTCTDLSVCKLWAYGNCAFFTGSLAVSSELIFWEVDKNIFWHLDMTKCYSSKIHLEQIFILSKMIFFII